MYKNILIATDGSELAMAAARHGLALAKALGATVTVATVTEPWVAAVPAEMSIAFPAEEFNKAAAANAARILAGVKKVAQELGTSCATRHVKDNFPAEGIVDTARELGCDLIIMASHGRRGLSRLFLGSQVNRVLTQTTIPVLVCR